MKVSDELKWRKADACTATATCVEVAKMEYDDGRIEYWVRDSKQGDGSPKLEFTEAEWAAFLVGARLGEFDFSDESPVQV
jgi:hypothetical protein